MCIVILTFSAVNGVINGTWWAGHQNRRNIFPVLVSKREFTMYNVQGVRRPVADSSVRGISIVMMGVPEDGRAAYLLDGPARRTKQSRPRSLSKVRGAIL